MLRWGGRLLAAALLLCLIVPMLALVHGVGGAELSRALDGGLVAALGRSLMLTAASLLVIVLAGTPLAWWIARHPGPLTGAAEVCVRVPLAAPPAVLGVALAAALAGSSASSLALVLAQVCVATPYFVLPTLAAFRTLDPELLWTARSLGASPASVFARVAVPLVSDRALEGLATSAARAFGELGASLLLVGTLMREMDGAAGMPRTAPWLLVGAEDAGAQQAAALVSLVVAVGLYFLIRSKLARRVLGRRG